jgi:hypothetical protein
MSGGENGKERAVSGIEAGRGEDAHFGKFCHHSVLAER